VPLNERTNLEDSKRRRSTVDDDDDDDDDVICPDPSPRWRYAGYLNSIYISLCSYM
jgi:hypothetical protein